MSSISRKGEKCMSGFCSGKEGKLPEERVAGCVRPWMEAGEKWHVHSDCRFPAGKQNTCNRVLFPKIIYFAGNLKCWRICVIYCCGWERWNRNSVWETQNKGTGMSGKIINSLERNHLVFGCSPDELLNTQGGTLDILHMPVVSVSFSWFILVFVAVWIRLSSLFKFISYEFLNASKIFCIVFLRPLLQIKAEFLMK